MGKRKKQNWGSEEHSYDMIIELEIPQEKYQEAQEGSSYKK
jgi:hypothetical protein